MCRSVRDLLNKEAKAAAASFFTEATGLFHESPTGMREKALALCREEERAKARESIKRMRQPIWYSIRHVDGVVSVVDRPPNGVPPAFVKGPQAFDEREVLQIEEGLDRRIASMSWTDFQLISAILREAQTAIPDERRQELELRYRAFCARSTFREGFVAASLEDEAIGKALASAAAKGDADHEAGPSPDRPKKLIPWEGQQRKLITVFERLGEDHCINKQQASRPFDEVLPHFSLPGKPPQTATAPRKELVKIRWCKAIVDLLGLFSFLREQGLISEKTFSHKPSLIAAHFSYEDGRDIACTVVSSIFHTAVNESKIDDATKYFRSLLGKA